MSKARLATVWLDGCSGCHMSFLDIDEGLVELADRIDLVYSPLVDFKEFPEAVDVTLVEGAVSSEEDLHKIRKIRGRTRLLLALGDCAVTANVPAMRNPFPVAAIMDRAYRENVSAQPQIPKEGLPALCAHARPVHELVKVDAFIQGCPPAAGLIHFVVTEILEGRMPGHGVRTRFG